jgi:hypothetical protein
MKCINATSLRRKSGQMGHPTFVAGAGDGVFSLFLGWVFLAHFGQGPTVPDGDSDSAEGCRSGEQES